MDDTAQIEKSSCAICTLQLHEYHVECIYLEALLGTKQRALSFARCYAVLPINVENGRQFVRIIF